MSKACSGTSLDAMAPFWLLFAIVLFVIEPLGLLERAVRTDGDAARNWCRMQRLHWVLLVIALGIVGAAVIGSHGFVSTIVPDGGTRVPRGFRVFRSRRP
jgi:hypothetical protein